MLRPTAVKVIPLKNYVLFIIFSNQEKKIFDIEARLEQPHFKRLRDTTLFNKVYLDGISIEWEGNIGICPDELYEQSTTLTNSLQAKYNITSDMESI